MMEEAKRQFVTSVLAEMSESQLDAMMDIARGAPVAAPTAAMEMETTTTETKTTSTKPAKKTGNSRNFHPVVKALKRMARLASSEEVHDYLADVVGWRVPADRQEALRQIRSQLTRSSASVRNWGNDMWSHRSVKPTTAPAIVK